MKQLWMLVGGNGAGKTTFYEQFLKSKGLPFINADIIAKELYPDDVEASSLKAARIAEQIRYSKLREGVSFCFETVFSHPSKIDFIASAKALGYQTHLIWIHVENSALNEARVYQRVQAGGHSVPVDKIHSRIPNTMKNIRHAVALCDSVWVFDNSRADSPFEKILILDEGNEVFRREPLPDWVMSMR